MALKVVVAAAVAANTPFVITVPGQEQWNVLSVCALLTRAVGGTPNRAYSLVIANQTNTLLAAPASDAGTEPGTGTITWTNGNPNAVASGGTLVSLGALAPVVILPGYTITGTVLNGAAADQWTRAVAWVDYAPT